MFNKKKLSFMIMAAVAGVSFYSNDVTYAASTNDFNVQVKQILDEYNTEVDKIHRESDNSVRAYDKAKAEAREAKLRSERQKSEKQILEKQALEKKKEQNKEKQLSGSPVKSSEAVPVPKSETKVQQRPKSVPPVPAKPATPAKPAVAAGTYNFDWRGAQLAQSLYSVAKIANKGVVINAKVEGSVFMSLKNVTCNQALDYLSRAFNFNWMVDGNNIIISDKENMKQSEIFNISFANKDKVKEELSSIGISSENIYANSEMGTISVTGTPYQLQEAKKRITAIDHPVSQCLIVAQLIEINHGDDLDLGLQYSMPTYSHSPGDAMPSGGKGWVEKLNFSVGLNANKAFSKGRVIARPMVLSLNGEKGIVNFGDEVPVLSQTATASSTNVTVEYKDVGTKLEITPVINDRIGEVSMQVKTIVSNISGWVASGQTKAPQISKREATTSVHVKSGQSFAIGGLMSVTELDNLSGIPGLMNLPILGKLFSYHSKSKDYAEIYVLITPYIVNDTTDPKTIMKQFDSEEGWNSYESFKR